MSVNTQLSTHPAIAAGKNPSGSTPFTVLNISEPRPIPRAEEPAHHHEEHVTRKVVELPDKIIDVPTERVIEKVVEIPEYQTVERTVEDIIEIPKVCFVLSDSVLQ